METPGIPVNEQERLQALRLLAILDTAPDERFERLTRMAKRLFDAPIALVSLVDEDRQWFKSCNGLSIFETARDISFCGHAILRGDVLVIPDTLADARFDDNPLVTGPPHIRFYAGCPLRTSNGACIGTLCVIDTRPRDFGRDEIAGLRDLAAMAESEFNFLGWTMRMETMVEKIVERRPLAAQAMLAAIVKGSNDAIIAKNLDSRITTWNPAATTLFGYTEREMLGKPVIMLFPPERVEEELRIIARIRDGKIVDSFDTVRIRKDGTQINVSVTVSPIFDEHGRVIGASKICRDISERKKMEQRQQSLTASLDTKVAALVRSETALQQLNDNLERQVRERVEQYEIANRELAESLRKLSIAQNELVDQERLSSLGAMVAGISHELNTPIGNALLLTSSLEENAEEMLKLLQEPKVNKQQLSDMLVRSRDMGNLAMKSISAAAGLVKSFKQVAVDQASEHRREFNLCQVVSDIISTIMATHKRDAGRWEISNLVSPGVICDSYPGPLGQIVSNVVQNAIVHGFDGRTGGKIEITCKAGAHDTILLKFADNGKGIAENALCHIFDPFYTTRLGQGGSGLGLAVCYRIATTILGGNIKAASRLDDGATFTLSFPRSAPFKMA